MIYSVAVPDLVEPLIERQGSDDAALQRHVGHALKPGQLDWIVLLGVAGPVFDHVDLHADGADFLKAGMRTLGRAVTEVDQEIERGVWTVPQDSHRRLPAPK